MLLIRSADERGQLLRCSRRGVVTGVGVAITAEHSSLSTIGWIWKAFELSPHREDGFKLANGPRFVAKVKALSGCT